MREQPKTRTRLQLIPTRFLANSTTMKPRRPRAPTSPLERANRKSDEAFIADDCRSGDVWRGGNVNSEVAVMRRRSAGQVWLQMVGIGMDDEGQPTLAPASCSGTLTESGWRGITQQPQPPPLDCLVLVAKLLGGWKTQGRWAVWRTRESTWPRGLPRHNWVAASSPHQVAQPFSHGAEPLTPQLIGNGK